ncbi:hypothetical protein [Butyrivibrio sp. AE3006]|uniref:hypothetical protein n=1 Tax=Butyrivibrio sp. AE3006 TaxID=1280673 RepID=UPI000409EBC2|nr:hypothetical protein [Butyrivibrio sp. AE3006]
MKKKGFLIVSTAIVLMIIVLNCYIMQNQVRFDGDRVCSKNPNRFYLNFNMMNTDDSETMVLNEGETLHVSWQIDGGKADVMIAMADEAPIYRADNCGKGENADFDLTIPKTGEYTTSISAYRAKGWLEVKEKKTNVQLEGKTMWQAQQKPLQHL